MADRSFLAAPLDTLWFRSSSPMDAGGTTGAVAADTLFPPTPYTWQGMIRTHLLEAALGERLSRASSNDIARIVGPPNHLPAGWRIRGPFPAEPCKDSADHLMPWLPWPRCVGVSTDDETSRPVSSRYAPKSNSVQDGFVTSSATSDSGELELLIPFDRPSFPIPASGWLSLACLRAALVETKGEAAGDRWRWDEARLGTKRSGAVLPRFVAKETRTGLELDDSRTARDEMLYTAHHVRFRDGSGLWGALEGAGAEEHAALTSGVAFAGRKTRAVSLHPASIPEAELSFLSGAYLANLAPEQLEYVRVVLLTPALGPTAYEAREQIPFKVPEGARLVARQSAAGPFIGGTNWVDQASRPLASTWAPGSIWVFHLADPATRVLAAQTLAGVGTNGLTDAERFGFGQRVVAPLPSTMILPIRK